MFQLDNVELNKLEICVEAFYFALPVTLHLRCCNSICSFGWCCWYGFRVLEKLIGFEFSCWPYDSLQLIGFVLLMILFLWL